VSARIASRPDEVHEIADFLVAASARPSALVIEGAPGIGKTTLWLDAVQQATERGFLVLSTRPAEADSVLAYASLADLLAGVITTARAGLPEPQQRAVDRILLRDGSDDAATDQRAVSAAFVSIVERLTDQTPVLVAVDDVQWLDPSSAQVVAFAARRLSARVGLLGAVRTGPDLASAAWLRIPRSDAIRRIEVHPLSVGALHALIYERLGMSFPRPTMLRIAEVSGGNPFYALELARAMERAPTSAEVPIPKTLTELVRTRTGSISAEEHQVLLAAACVASPTVELISRAVGIDTAHVVEIIQNAEDKGIIATDGERVRFAHPLLAHGIYTNATPAQRRAMHRGLSEIVDEPELRARHRARAVTWADPETLQALDEGAEMAMIRGAPSAAAELLDLAVGLGGDTPQRRIRLAGYWFNSGDSARARAELEAIAAGNTPPLLRAQALNVLGVISQLEASLVDAANEFGRALHDAEGNIELRIRILTSLSWVQVRIGQHAASARSIEDAVADAERLGNSHLLSEALGMQVVVQFLLGMGLDDQALSRALELEARAPATSVHVRPSFQNAMLLSWAGQVDAAHTRFADVRQSCIDHGDESDLVLVSFHAVFNAIRRGDFPHATLIAEDAAERALHLDGPLQLSAALTARAAVAAYAGRETDARRDIRSAIEPATRSGSQLLTGCVVGALGFLELSLGNHEAAIAALEPLLGRFSAWPEATEIFVAGFLPDAVEAMTQLGRLAEAEPLVDMLERNGRRLDRPWMLAVGARCRTMLLAAHGDVDAALGCVQQAMVEHRRLPMPFEYARTQLLLGRIQRRLRQRDAAATTFREALSTFDALSTPLWADRVRAELNRATVRRGAIGLTAAERRVAELAASGMTNRDVAAALFISQKTVEANLSRIYRKFDIRSRAELGRIVGRVAPI
jgi:DNA-binding CsgD family transcriptional regulator/DNA-binding MarR family transcriptional regulator